MGRVDQKFVDAIGKTSTIDVHARYYQEAIKTLIEGGEEIDILGYSFGGQLLPYVLNDESIANRTNAAILVCPSGSTSMTFPEIATAAVKERGKVNLRNYTKNIQSISLGKTADKEQQALKKRVRKSVVAAAITKSEEWKNLRVGGGKVIVVSGMRDEMTKTYKTFQSNNIVDLRELNPQLEVVELLMSHTGPIVDPKQVIEKVFQTQ
jgi:hypothetical protein